MAETRLAAQLYTLREFTKTPRDVGRTLEKLAADGWRAVQASGLGPIEPTELKKMLDANGLSCCATHDSLARYTDEPAAVIDQLHILDCQYTALGAFSPKPAEFTRETWQAFIDRFNAASAVLESGGVRLGYHNHSHEWAAVGPGGPRAIDLLADGLTDRVWFEIDTYWVAHAGGDPAAWIGRFSGRIPCVHLKDRAVAPGREPFMAEVGRGNLNWPAILAACGRAGVAWYIVEQDTCDRDPFESLRISLASLQEMGLN